MSHASDVYVTRHARQRTKQRVGLSKRLADQNARKALEKGICHKNTRGSLNRYLTKVYFSNPAANNIRIYCENVYIFKGQMLITVWQLPPEYRKTALHIQKKLAQERHERVGG